MTTAAFILALLTLAAAVAAMTLRNLVHCALFLALAFAGLAGIYVLLGAEFVGLAQLLVYVGAVAVLILFALVLTRGIEPIAQPVRAVGWLYGACVALIVFVAMALPVFRTTALGATTNAVPPAPVARIGEELMRSYILPLEALGLLLTAALIGAVVLALGSGRRS